MIRSIISHTVTAIASASVVATYLTISNENENSRQNDEVEIIEKKSTIDVMRFSPNLPIYLNRVNKNLQIAFDTRTRNPLYVMEKIHVQKESDKSSKNNRASFKFYENKDLAQHFRSRNHQYKNSGFDRGHMAPAADFLYDEQAMRDTFSLCNISPQYSSVNRGAWASLEDFTRKVAKEEVESNNYVTYVYSGPMWLPVSVRNIALKGTRADDQNHQVKERYHFSYDAIGKPPSLVSVPSHFFKVIAVVDERSNKGTIKKIAAFVLSNIDTIDSHETFKSKSPVLVKIRDLEAVTGIQFASNVSTPTSLSEEEDSVNEWKDVIDEKTELLMLSNRKNYSELVPFHTNLTKGTKGKKARRLKMSDSDIEHLCASGGCNRILRYT